MTMSDSDDWDAEDAMLVSVTDACIWCKTSPEDAMDHVEFKSIGGTDELLCSVCAMGLRKYKRTIGWQFVISTNFPESVAQQVSDAVGETVATELSELYDEDVEPPDSTLTRANAATVGTEDTD